MPSRPRGFQQSPGKRPRDESGRLARKSKGRDRRRPRQPAIRSDDSQAAGQRLQSVLAAAGLGSRRQCEELIAQGRVEIDRQVVTELGTRVDPVAREIRVDGTVLHGCSHVYYALNKPTGVLSTNNDPSGRARVIDLVPASAGRLFSVGRLDLNSEGLILLTNDGELANRLTHPRYGVEKTYRVLVAGETTAGELEQLRRGIHLAEGVARVARVKARAEAPAEQRPGNGLGRGPQPGDPPRVGPGRAQSSAFDPSGHRSAAPGQVEAGRVPPPLPGGGRRVAKGGEEGEEHATTGAGSVVTSCRVGQGRRGGRRPTMIWQSWSAGARLRELVPPYP